MAQQQLVRYGARSSVFHRRRCGPQTVEHVRKLHGSCTAVAWKSQLGINPHFLTVAHTPANLPNQGRRSMRIPQCPTHSNASIHNSTCCAANPRGHSLTSSDPCNAKDTPHHLDVACRWPHPAQLTTTPTGAQAEQGPSGMLGHHRGRRMRQIALRSSTYGSCRACGSAWCSSGDCNRPTCKSKLFPTT